MYIAKNQLLNLSEIRLCEIAFLIAIVLLFSE